MELVKVTEELREVILSFDHFKTQSVEEINACHALKMYMLRLAVCPEGIYNCVNDRIEN